MEEWRSRKYSIFQNVVAELQQRFIFGNVWMHENVNTRRELSRKRKKKQFKAIKHT